MPLSIYEAAVPSLLRGLKNLSGILDKGLKSAEARNIDPAVLLQARLAPDMFALSRQVQSVCDSAKGAARLADVEVPSHADTETTFPELQERINKTLGFLDTLTPARFEGGEDRIISLPMPTRELKLPGRVYLFGFVLPNFYFHTTAAYMILRHNGVDVGKMDFLGGA